MNHQGTTIEKKFVQVDDESKEVVKKSTSAYEPSDEEKTLARTERFRTIANWVVGAIVSLLGARFLLSILAANAGAGFFQFVLVASEPLVAPFTSLFGMPAFGASVVDTAALVGMVVYPVVGYGLISLLKAIMAPSDPTGRAYR